MTALPLAAYISNLIMESATLSESATIKERNICNTGIISCKTSEALAGTKLPQGWDRFYYPFSALETMLQDITKAKRQKLRDYGPERYEQFMLKNKDEGKNKAGFWANCMEV